MKRLLGLIIVLVLSLQLIWPLFNNAYFPMHDDTQVGRVVAMGKALRWGQFPVRWVSDLGYGYGYPIFNFYGPLPYYVGGFFYALGFSGLVATKIMMAMGMILAGVTMFLFTSSIMGVLPAIVSGILYAYAPYHAVQLYVRGAVGELWTLVFFPLLAWGLVRVRRGETAKFIGALGLAGVILSHTLMGYATVVLVVIALTMYCIMQIIRKKDTRPLLIAYCLLLVIGLGLTAFFWLPAIVEMRFTDVSGQIGTSADFRDHFVCLSQLWSSPWGFGGSAKGCLDGLSFMIGKLHIITGVLALMLWLLRKPKSPEAIGTMVLGLLTLGAGIFLMTPGSRVVWEVVAGFAYLQYPWRFLVYATFGLSLLGGVLVSLFRTRLMRLFLCVVIVLGSLSLYAKWFGPKYLYSRSASEFETPQELRMRVSKISDEYMPPDFVRPIRDNEFVYDTLSSSDKSKVNSIVETDTYSRFAITAAEEEKLEVKRAFFPGLVILVNGKKQNLQITNGLPAIFIPKGENVVEMQFVNTPVRSLGNMISLVVALGLLFYYGKKVNA